MGERLLGFLFMEALLFFLWMPVDRMFPGQLWTWSILLILPLLSLLDFIKNIFSKWLREAESSYFEKNRITSDLPFRALFSEFVEPENNEHFKLWEKELSSGKD